MFSRCWGFVGFSGQRASHWSLRARAFTDVLVVHCLSSRGLCSFLRFEKHGLGGQDWDSSLLACPSSLSWPPAVIQAILVALSQKLCFAGHLEEFSCSPPLCFGLELEPKREKGKKDREVVLQAGKGSRKGPEARIRWSILGQWWACLLGRQD